MCPSDVSSPDPAAAARRVAELEAETARLRQSLADAELSGRRLLHELQHRVRNTLAVVRSISRRTARPGGTAEDYAMHLDGRLDAVTRAETRTAGDPMGGVSLDGLIAEELLAHTAHEGERVSLSGPTILLRGKAARTLWLAVHELAVNAVKYGALSAPRGHIAVTWSTGPGDAVPAQASEGETGRGRGGHVLRLEWQETGVPVPDAPPRRGFGTEVIERTLAYELGATASLGFGPDGARCIMALPLTDEILVGDSGP